MPWCGAVCGCRKLRDQVRCFAPNRERFEHIGVSRDGSMRAAYWGTESHLNAGEREHPRCHSLAGLLGNLELHRSLRLLLHDDCTSRDALPMRNVPDTELYEITGPKLAIDRKVKQGKLPGPFGKLQSDANCPDILISLRRRGAF